MNLYIFDCFGVICGEIAPIWFAEKCGQKGAELKDKYFKVADRGGMDIYQVIEKIADDLHFDRQSIVDDWQKLMVIDKNVLNLIAELKQVGRTALLSNAPEKLIPWVFRDIDIAKYFDKIYVSGECKIAKPDLEFYNMCIDGFNEHFEHIYMVDDNVKNLQGLSTLNITPILYSDEQTLRRDLGRQK